MDFNYKDNAQDVMVFLSERVWPIIEEASETFEVNPVAPMVGLMVMLNEDFRDLDATAANALALSLAIGSDENLRMAQELLAAALNRMAEDEDQR